MAEHSQECLHGQWVHSHEEDTEREMVFRPASHSFPPARGRTRFELRPDGTYEGSAPGPVDRPVASSGSWSLEGDRLVLTGEGESSRQDWEIAGAEVGRLTLRR